MHPILKKIMKTGLVTVGIGLFIYWGFFLYLVNKSPLTYDELDLNNDGVVSFSEVEYSSNFGKRNVIKDEKECIEYFALKDGLPLKIECEGGS